ncbi:benzoate/H(+) symporter BenE family transporter [Thalassospira sp. A40-3]|uniref:benzoate/H(+) symporter BenE family transporter n=1 Tax=Thalassospira TaxID=168934 RepID=UPI0002872D64|nr:MULTISPECIES: benzoate/H(+) symporter BenE family transporter [Thalassospira]EKF07264.1 benzoate transporter [Thalassospira profundimaris WP0211]QPO10372.1 benzoate/H(+) symporter BenE family transporter [Thalassospira sp. A40-3]
MLRDISPQSIFMGLLAGFVGTASSFAVVLQGLAGVGASPEQAASGLMALSISMGLCAIVLSLKTRLPISIAWSTPGAALLATSGAVEGGFAVAVGAFIVCAILIIISGIWKPLGRAVAGIPAPLANAMLAGVLLGLCLAPVKAVAFDPLLGLPIVIAWIVMGRFNRLLAIPAALLAFVAVMVFGVEFPENAIADLGSAIAPPVEFVMPEFTLTGLIGIALPLFIVTMASQNIPGTAVLRANDYDTPPGPLFTVTGIFSLLSAPFGGHAVNLAAITAALCAGKDAHPDPSKRYWAAVSGGVFYVVFGLLAGLVTAFISLAPGVLIEAVAGLALIGAFAGSAVAAFKEEDGREAAAVTFIVTAAGLTFYGISGAFWGLLAGGLIYFLMHLRNGKKKPD